MRSDSLRRFFFAVAALTLYVPFMFLPTGTGKAQAADEQITLFAAASTSTALTEILERYNAQSDIKARAVFAASSTLAKQIANGAPADLFLSANQRWMDYLVGKTAVEAATSAPLLSNRLVLIVSARNPIASEALPEVVGASTPMDKILGDSRLAIGDPAHVPAGIYAKAALQKLGLWTGNATKMAFSGNVRTALALVERGEAAAGIVYETDATIVSNVRFAGVFPEDSHPPIVYPLAIVAGRGGTDVESFYRFLRGPEAREILARHGFSRPDATQ